MRGVSSTFHDAAARERIFGTEQNYICATKRRCCWRPVSQTACEHAKNSDFLQTRNKRKRIDFLIPVTFPGSLGVNLSHHNASERWKSAYEALVGANLLFITKMAWLNSSRLPLTHRVVSKYLISLLWNQILY